ncbi:hypothetical protein EDB92DRAFT_1812856 [Lactarius akahatsu]|uniref:Uncharacterized protein n=1 Tax=Lactarius akahatsu TaxID=416441 RepID=A0AAD4LTB2_9AGAM|nr:hypothetical protein EDB92DRAFT_1812856 [Lactarius akahatsu]
MAFGKLAQPWGDETLVLVVGHPCSVMVVLVLWLRIFVQLGDIGGGVCVGFEGCVATFAMLECVVKLVMQPSVQQAWGGGFGDVIWVPRVIEGMDCCLPRQPREAGKWGWLMGAGRKWAQGTESRSKREGSPECSGPRWNVDVMAPVIGTSSWGGARIRVSKNRENGVMRIQKNVAEAESRRSGSTERVVRGVEVSDCGARCKGKSGPSTGDGTVVGDRCSKDRNEQGQGNFWSTGVCPSSLENSRGSSTAGVTMTAARGSTAGTGVRGRESGGRELELQGTRG